MKLCLMYATWGNMDEGMKNVGYNLSKKLSKNNDVMRLDPRDFEEVQNGN